MLSNTVHVGFRMTPEEKKLLKMVSDARGEATSSFIRRSVLKELAFLDFLPEKRRKALRVSINLTQESEKVSGAA